MARVYVDENLGGGFVSALRRFGHDVVLAGERAGGRTDAWHFREALEDGRVLITLDKRDFQYFHRLWTTLRTMNMTEREHAGILVAVQSKGFAQAAWLSALREKLVVPEALQGRMSRWHPEAGWHEDAWRPEE